MLSEIFSWFLLVGGGFFVFVGGIGLIRLPDFYTRIHAAGLTDTLGAGMILCGLMVQSDNGLVTAKLLMILFFILFTSPASTHALVKAALFSGVRPVVSHGDADPTELTPAKPSPNGSQDAATTTKGDTSS